jgi:LPXTG-motif cell wall-anchored protein
LRWSSGKGGGPPIVAAGLVWTIGQDGELYGLDPGTGTVHQQASIGVPANHFPTPAVAGGYLLAPSARNVVAFAATSSGAAPSASAAASAAGTPHPTPASHSASSPTATGGAGFPPAATAGIAGGLVVIGWVLWRRRRRGAS